MYDYLIGKITYLEGQQVVLESQGTGYLIETPTTVCDQLKINQETRIYVYHHVSENEIAFYGFLDRFTKKVFLLLISVSGVGPKMGIRILSYKKARDLIESVALKDLSDIKGVKGLGEKTSQRLILEVQKKAEELLLLEPSGLNEVGEGKRVSNIDPSEITGEDESVVSKGQTDYRTGHVEMIRIREDLKSALIQLGYKEGEVGRVVDEVFWNRKNKSNGYGNLEEVFEQSLKEALQRLSSF